MENPDSLGHNPSYVPSGNFPNEHEEVIDLHDIFRRLARGFAQIIGLALLGLVIAATAYLAASRFFPVATSTRVVFSFPGFAKGLYPDGSKFAPDDLLSLT